MTGEPLLAGAPAVALTGLSGAYRPRPVTPLVPWRSDKRLVKPYVVTAPGRSWDDTMIERVREFAVRQLAFDDNLGGVGLGVVVLHLADVTTHLLVQTWASDFHSRLSLFTGLDIETVRPSPIGVGPCVWEQEVLSHERTSYVTHVLKGDVDLAAWLEDVLDTRPRPSPDAFPSGV